MSTRIAVLYKNTEFDQELKTGGWGGGERGEDNECTVRRGRTSLEI